jgi:transposase-like protein
MWLSQDAQSGMHRTGCKAPPKSMAEHQAKEAGNNCESRRYKVHACNAHLSYVNVKTATASSIWPGSFRPAQQQVPAAPAC